MFEVYTQKLVLNIQKIMKKSILLSTAFTVLFGLLSLSASAQDKKNVIKTNLFGAFAGQYQLAYERVLNENSAFQLSAGIISRTGSQTMGVNSYESKTSGFIIIPEYRYYLGKEKESPKGFYVAPFARMLLRTNNLTDKSENTSSVDVSRKEKVTAVGGGVALGYQALIGNVVSLDFAIGPQYKSRSTTTTYNQAGVTDEDFNSKFIDFKIQDRSGLGVRIAVGLGIAF
jgi:hypothetical protein